MIGKLGAVQAAKKGRSLGGASQGAPLILEQVTALGFRVNTLAGRQD